MCICVCMCARVCACVCVCVCVRVRVQARACPSLLCLVRIYIRLPVHCLSLQFKTNRPERVLDWIVLSVLNYKISVSLF